MSRAHLALRRFDRRLRDESACTLVGVDEVGRGSLAGPVVAAAVILVDEARLPGLDDSKELCAAERCRLASEIRVQARAIGLSFVGPRHIDAVNIRRASLLAMRRAIRRAEIRLRHAGFVAGGSGGQACLVLVDGIDVVPGVDWPQRTLVSGDGRSLAVAAASVVAKTVRDGFMARLGAEFPHYGFERNMGYGTPEHLDALVTRGPCAWHRYSYAPVAQIGLFAADAIAT
jgi:ribonuclease HII